MYRIIALALALFVSLPAAAQVTANLPVTCNASGTSCVQATPVTNPDGTNVGGSSGGPSSSQLPASLGPKTGANSLSVVPNTDTAFPVTCATCATAAKQDTMITNQTATGASAQNIQGNVASGAADAGNGVKVAGVYSASSTIATVAVGNRIDAQADIYGNLRSRIAGGSPQTPSASGTSVISAASASSNTLSTILPLATMNYVWDGTNAIPQPGNGSGAVLQPYATASSRWGYAAASGGITNTTTAVTIAPAVASVRNYVTGLQCMSSTLGAATELAIRDGAGGTVLWRGYLSTTALGAANFDFGVPLKGTANTLVEIVTLTASITGAVYCNAQGFTAP